MVFGDFFEIHLVPKTDAHGESYTNKLKTFLKAKGVVFLEDTVAQAPSDSDVLHLAEGTDCSAVGYLVEDWKNLKDLESTQF